jgi:hypothetical protein
MLLAQLLGLYFIIVGALALYRRKSIMPAISQMLKNRPLVIILSMVEVFAGLAIVLTYPDLTLDWRGLISVVGWMMLAEGIIYLALPYGKVQRIVRSFNRDAWYRMGGAVAVIAGIYLAGVGFGFF